MPYAPCCQHRTPRPFGTSGCTMPAQAHGAVQPILQRQSINALCRVPEQGCTQCGKNSSCSTLQQEIWESGRFLSGQVFSVFLLLIHADHQPPSVTLPPSSLPLRRSLDTLQPPSVALQVPSNCVPKYRAGHWTLRVFSNFKTSRWEPKDSGWLVAAGGELMSAHCQSECGWLAATIGG